MSRPYWDHEVKKALRGYDITPVGGGITTHRWTLWGAKMDARARQGKLMRAKHERYLLQQPPVWTTAEDRK